MQNSKPTLKETVTLINYIVDIYVYSSLDGKIKNTYREMVLGNQNESPEDIIKRALSMNPELGKLNDDDRIIVGIESNMEASFDPNTLGIDKISFS